jgi:hypothetical protein
VAELAYRQGVTTISNEVCVTGVAAPALTRRPLQIAFTTEHINKNFSNYSAWHYRSALLPRLVRDPLDDGKREADSKSSAAPTKPLTLDEYKKLLDKGDLLGLSGSAES